MMDKEEYLLAISKTVSLRGTCPDLQVGCVIATRDGFILSTGYNGTPRGEDHCRVWDDRCMENDDRHRVVHAEANAVANAARNGTKLLDSTAYVTHDPCIKCRALLKQAGVIMVVVDGFRSVIL